MSADQIHSALVFVLSAALGKTEEHWSALIEIEVLNIVFNVQGNWRVRASGTEFERKAIMKAVQLLAATHPYAYE